MRSSRLALALETGALTLPSDGDILVLNAQSGDDLSSLPRDRLVLVQTMRSEHDALAAQGFSVTAEVPVAPFAAAIVCLPRARDHARALVAQAAGAAMPGGTVAVDGQKTDGVDAALRELRARLPVSEPLAKAHGRLFTLAAGPGLEDWLPAIRLVEGGFATLPGVFSADGPDPASVLLAEALPEALPGHGVDLGAGWGYLAHAALSRRGVRSVDLVEADHTALACARINITDPRAAFHWVDAMRFRPARPADWVVMNPPFHAGRRAEPALGAAFLSAAAGMLAADGVLWLVANRHLPYGPLLTTLFREIDDIGGSPAFRLTRAARPLPPPRKART
ncbi:MAG: class I SAM-dependent methyltransferase [Paracoccaceae bacterium]|nr:MAG: class I SAM-dependent methyltransferase [Paracoccaceae bacterium]